MNPVSGFVFLEKAKTLTTLEKWEEYAWCITPSALPVIEVMDTTTDRPQGNLLKLPIIPFQ